MKRGLSVILSTALLLSLLPGSLMMSHAAPERTAKVWYEADFNDGTLGDVSIRNSDGYVGHEFVEDGDNNKALHITRRPVFYNGINVNVSDMLKNTDIEQGEGYSMGFRMKAEEGQKFWLYLELYDPKNEGGEKLGNGGLGGSGQYFLITDQWTTVNLSDYYFMNGDGSREWANPAVAGDIGFITFDYVEGTDTNRGDPNTMNFYIDDVKVSAPTEVQTDSVRAEGVWYEADFNDGALGDVSIRNSDGYVGHEFVEDGDNNKALHITRRPVFYNGINVNVSDMLKNTDIEQGEGYSMGFRMKAEEGQKFWLYLELYDPKNEGGEKLGNGGLGGSGQYFLITDQWTTVNLSDYYFMNGDGSREWANPAVAGDIGFITFDYVEGTDTNRGDPNTMNFYIDDVKVSAPYDQAADVAAFVDAVENLPAADAVALGDKQAIESAEALYSALGERAGMDKKAVDAAKARLDTVRAAYDSLSQPPEEEDPPAPDAYTETFRDYPLGPTVNEDGSINEGKRIEKDPAHVRENGGRYLHITDRPAGDESAFYWHNVNAAVKAQGPGKYELRFWAKSGGSEGTRIQLLKGSTYLNPTVTITDEWAQYTVKLETKEYAVSEADVENGFNFTFINNYMTNTDDLFLDDIAFVKTGDLPSTEPEDPEDSDALIPDGGFENADEGEEQRNGTIVRDETLAQEGSQFLLIGNRPAGDEAVLWNTALNTVKLTECGAGNYKLSFWLRAAQNGQQTRMNAYIVGKRDGEESTFYFNMAPGTEGKNAAVAGDEWTQFVSEPLVLPQLDSAMLYICNWYNSDSDRTDFYLDGLALDPTEDTPSTDITIEPEYDYENPDNLLDPYGSFDTLQGGNKLWNGVVVADPDGAHSGSNYLKISDRHTGDYKFNFCVGVGDIIRDNGAGKYYYSCWLRTAEAGKTTTLQPILYFHDTAAEYWMAAITVTDEWTFFGVTYDQIETYFNEKGDGLPLPGNVAEFRFYNAPGETEYPDYLIDDMAFWKYTGKQENPGNDNPETGVPTPVIPAVLLSGSMALMLTAARKRRKNMIV